MGHGREAAAHIGIVQQLKTGLQLFADISNLETQARIGCSVAVHKEPVGRKAQTPWGQGHGCAQLAVQESFDWHCKQKPCSEGKYARDATTHIPYQTPKPFRKCLIAMKFTLYKAQTNTGNPCNV